MTGTPRTSPPRRSPRSTPTTDALVAHLADNGITVDVETDDNGIRFPALDENTDDATWDLIDQYYEDTYGPFEDLDIDDWDAEDLTAEEIAEINADTDALVAHLADNGITVDVETDDNGIRFPALDENTDDATWDLIDQYYEDTYGPFEDLEGCEFDMDDEDDEDDLDGEDESDEDESDEDESDEDDA